jgi:hypothetical protein
LCKDRIDAYDAHVEMDIPIHDLNILDAISFAADAWDRVDSTTIASCWRETKILPPSPDDFINLPIDINEDEEAVQHLINRLQPERPLTAREYLDIDLTLRTEDKLDDDAIISLVQGEEAIEEEIETAAEPTTITSADAIKLIDNLTSFLTHQENHVQVSEKFLYELKNVKRELCKSIIDSKIQMDITSFLQPTA